MQGMRGKWLIELGEVDAIKNVRAVTQMKAFLSSATDHYRPSYGRVARDFPRQCVFAGSTNDEHYLEDQTGNRRFWPISCGTLDIASLQRDREQLFAEAVTRFREGWPQAPLSSPGEWLWWLTPEEEAAAADEQEARTEEDPWEPMIQDWLMCPVKPDGNAIDVAGGFTTSDVLMGAIGLSSSQLTRQAQTRVGNILRNYNQYERRGKPLTYRLKASSLPTSQPHPTPSAA
jgi:predicted P-loop ATPase